MIRKTISESCDSGLTINGIYSLIQKEHTFQALETDLAEMQMKHRNKMNKQPSASIRAVINTKK